MGKILLTGATGFIGSHLLERLLELKYDVIITQRANSNYWRIGHLSGYSAYEVPSELRQIFFDNKIDCVIHCATSYKKEDTYDDTVSMLEANTLFPVRLLELSVDHKVPKFINVSSYFQYDIRFSHFLYARTKNVFDTVFRNALKELKIKGVNAVLYNVFGPKDNNKFIPYAIKSLLNGDQISFTDDDDCEKFYFTPVTTVVDCLIDLIDRDIEKENFLIKNEDRTKSEIVGIIKEMIYAIDNKETISLATNFYYELYRTIKYYKGLI